MLSILGALVWRRFEEVSAYLEFISCPFGLIFCNLSLLYDISQSMPSDAVTTVYSTSLREK